MKLFKFKNLEITYPKSWTKPYNEIVIPEGFRLIRVWELWELLESEQAEEFLGPLKDEYCLFWCEQTRYAKRFDFSSRLYLDGNLNVYSDNDDLADPNSNGQVVFVKEEVKK